MPQAAPELSPALAWLNTNRPLRLEELRGEVVLVSFFAFSSVSCRQLLVALQQICAELKGRAPVLLGVHSATFAAEARPERVAQAIERYGIRCPVVCDWNGQVCDRFEVRSLPALVAIDGHGQIAAMVDGEPEVDSLRQLVLALIESTGTGPAREDVASSPEALPALPPQAGKAALVTIADERQASPMGLRFPSRVAVSPDGRLAISDTGHARIVILDAAGMPLLVLGGDRVGAGRGPFRATTFASPSGLAWDGDLLWVCDAGSHTLVRVDLRARTTSTMAGTGALGREPLRGEQPGTEIALRAPIDVVVDDTRLYLALAGSHQLATYDKQQRTIRPLAGSGCEELKDGHAPSACFAQPAGLALYDGTLFIADSGSSSVRTLDLGRDMLETLVGRGLSAHGYLDGPRAQARLQYPQGLAYDPGLGLLVADAYNDCVRVIDVGDGSVSTFFRGRGDHALFEPAGLALLREGGLLVADENNHRLVKLTRDGRFAEVLGTPGALPRPAAGLVPSGPRP